MGLPDWYTRLQRLLGGGINNPMNNPQTVPGTSVGSDGRTYQIMEQGFSQPMTALPPSAASPGGRPPINLPPDQDNPGVNRLLAWQIYNQMGMPLDQWDDFERLEMSEAGYRATAKNPGSTAYGMGQFLDSTFRDYGAAADRHRRPGRPTATDDAVPQEPVPRVALRGVAVPPGERLLRAGLLGVRWSRRYRRRTRLADGRRVRRPGRNQPRNGLRSWNGSIRTATATRRS
jgi:hypothetical protein